MVIKAQSFEKIEEIKGERQEESDRKTGRERVSEIEREKERKGIV